MGSGVLRSAGNSRDPFHFLVVARAVNIVLDLVFVACFRWGVLGVAAATIISQLISVALVLAVMLKTTDMYQLCLRELKLDRKLLLEILDLGLHAGIQSSLISIGNLFTQRFVNLMGSAAMAGIGAAKTVDKFVGIIANYFAWPVGWFFAVLFVFIYFMVKIRIPYNGRRKPNDLCTVCGKRTAAASRK